MAEQGLLETEARYLNAEGKAVVTSLGELDPARLVHGLPVRAATSYAGQRHYPGLFWSATTGTHIGYESRLEAARLLLADYARDVAWIAGQPVWLTGPDGATVRRHVPDFFLQLRGGGYLLVDVKPAERAATPQARAQFDWTSRLCAARGWRYEVWTGASSQVLANLRFLAVGRRAAFIDPEAVDAARRVGRPGIPLGQALSEAEAVAGGVGRAAVLSLLWRQEWTADLSVPLSGTSTLDFRPVIEHMLALT